MLTPFMYISKNTHVKRALKFVTSVVLLKPIQFDKGWGVGNIVVAKGHPWFGVTELNVNSSLNVTDCTFKHLKHPTKRHLKRELYWVVSLGVSDCKMTTIKETTRAFVHATDEHDKLRGNKQIVQ